MPTRRNRVERDTQEHRIEPGRVDLPTTQLLHELNERKLLALVKRAERE